MNRIFDFLQRKQSGIMKVIGMPSEEEYNYLLRKIYFGIKNTNTINYTDGIPFPSNNEIISIIQQSTINMNLNCIEKEEINLTNNNEFNKKLKKSIDTVLAKVLREKYFKSNNIKTNFFVKEIVWLYEILLKTNLNELNTIVYYGQMADDEKYYLEILGQVGFKILALSSDVDIDINASENIFFEKRSPYIKFNIRVAQGKDTLPLEEIIVVKSLAKQAKEQIETDFMKSGIFKPWSFRRGIIKSVNIDSVVEDITSYISEDSRFRPDFKVENNIIYVPNFFMKINGVYKDKNKYKSLLNQCIKNPLTIISEDLKFININSYPLQEIYSLAFTLNKEQTQIDLDLIKKHSLYSIKKYNIDAQELVLNKLNEFFLIYNNYIELKDFLILVYAIINLNDDLMVLIENFDFPYKIPKIIIYLDKRESLDIYNAMFIHYFNLLSFDIIIYSPTGAPCIEDYLFGQHISIIDLNEMLFDFPLNKAIENIKKDKSLLNKFYSFVRGI